MCKEQYSLTKPCGHTFENAGVVFAGSSTSTGLLQICAGSVNGREVEVIVGSGCTTVGVRKSLVKPDQFTGEVKHCRQFNGDLIQLPVARIVLKSQYFSGEVDACVIDNPVCDVILGRVPGSSSECTETVAAVQTRAQKAKERRPFRPLLTTKAPQLDVNSEQVGKLQREDASLESMFKKAESVDAVEDENSVTSFVVQEGLLYRRVRSK